jgi:metallo-beta-lactamase class B
MKTLKKLLLILAFCCTTTLTQAQPFPTDWFKPFPPFRIAGNLYYVGTRDLASYLIVTTQGNILINSDFDENVPLIKANIKTLGFRYSDTKILLISQAHIDHASGSALIKKQTGAKYEVMAEDQSVIETGGKTDYLYNNRPDMWFKPTTVDHTLQDGEPVTLGDTTLVAHLTPGHTKGCTTWTMQVKENGKPLQVVIVGGVTINPGTRLTHNDQYPTILEDYKKTWRILKSLPCDVFLGGHGIYFNLIEKYAALQKGVKHPFIDPQGYQKFIAEKERDFQNEVKSQSNVG